MLSLIKKINLKKVSITALIFSLSMLSGPRLFAEQKQINVFAAASLSDAMNEIAVAFEERYGIKVNLNLAGSNTLRLQIEKGVPCDVFISANAQNVRKLDQLSIIDHNKVTVLLTNRLVIVSENDNQRKFQNFDELILYAKPYLSLADPQTVPAGIYAKEALINAGLWPYVKDRVVPAVDVRAALVQVEMGNINYGIVYMTDAYISDKVYYPVYIIPDKYHSRIEYLACLIQERSDRAAGNLFYEFMKRIETLNIFQKYGFSTL